MQGYYMIELKNLLNSSKNNYSNLKNKYMFGGNLLNISDDLKIKLRNLVIFFIVYTLCFIIFTSTIKYTIPFVLAGIFASILKRPTKFFIEKVKIKSWLASLIMTLLFFCVVVSITVYLIMSVTSELISVGKGIQEFVANNSTMYVTEFSHWAKNTFDNLNIDPATLEYIGNIINNSLKDFVNIGMTLINSSVNFVFSTFGYIPYLAMVIIFTLLATYLFTSKMVNSNKDKGNTFIENNQKAFSAFTEGQKMLGKYCFNFLILVFFTFLWTFIGFSIFNVKYAFLLSILSALMDILPVVGMPIVYYPIAIIFFINGNVLAGIGILVLYVLVFVFRQVTEPKLMSSSLGISPIATLVAIFVGLQINGFSGMIFCMMLIVFHSVLKKVGIL